LLSRRKAALVFAATLAVVGHATAQEKSIVVASTTSTQDSGLFGYMLPRFKEKTGIAVNVMAVGTGQALEAGRHGQADVVFVHARTAELQFIFLTVDKH
jgi:tungstate transport system substrate-binding protein